MQGIYRSFGPISIRVKSRKKAHLAPWGFPWLQIGGLSLFSGTSSGGWVIAAYHPRNSLTWLWMLFTHGGRLRLKTQKRMPRKDDGQ